MSLVFLLKVVFFIGNVVMGMSVRFGVVLRGNNSV